MSVSDESAVMRANAPNTTDGMAWLNTKTGKVVRWCAHLKVWLPNDEIYLTASGHWMPKSHLSTVT